VSNKAKRKVRAGQHASLLVVISPKWSQRHAAAAEQLAAELGRPVCGAYTRKRTLCRNRPDPSRTNGRCRMHGARAGRPLKHGRYSKYAKVSYDDLDIPGVRFNVKAARIEEELSAVRAELRKLLRQPAAAVVDVGDGEQSAREVVHDTKLRALLERAAALVRERGKTMPGQYIPVAVVSRMIECREAIFFSTVEKYVADKSTVEGIRADYRRATRTFAPALFKELEAFRFAETAKRARRRRRAESFRHVADAPTPGEPAQLRRAAREEGGPGQKGDGEEEDGGQ
jgi:hypothetical protein